MRGTLVIVCTFSRILSDICVHAWEIYTAQLLHWKIDCLFAPTKTDERLLFSIVSPLYLYTAVHAQEHRRLSQSGVVFIIYY